MTPLYAALFFLSGVTGLLYETVWSDQFVVLFGAAEPAVAVVLATYMGGLTLGAALAARWAKRVSYPLRAYGILELVIGFWALFVQDLIEFAQRLEGVVLGGLQEPPAAADPAGVLFQLIAAALILLPPTALMGATLPLLARGLVHRDATLGPRVALLYATNALGAAAGAAVTAFLLIPGLGSDRAVWVGVVGNLLIGIAAWALGRGSTPSPEGSPSPAAEKTRTAPALLAAATLAGAAGLGAEVLWVRLLNQLVGGTIYSLGTMLSVYLVGIGLGSLVVASWCPTRERARTAAMLAALLLTVALPIAFRIVDRLPHLLGRFEDSLAQTGSTALLSALVLLPGALAGGALFPALVRALGSSASVARDVAKVYALNTAGAIAGALGMSFLSLPLLGLNGSVWLLTTLALLAGLLILSTVQTGRRALLTATVASLLAVVVSTPQTPWNLLRSSPLSRQAWNGTAAYLKAGTSSTVLLTERHGQWRLTTNGLPESAIELEGSLPGPFGTARWLSLLPWSLHDAPREALIVGLGAGLTAAAVPNDAERVDVIEIEEGVLEANRRLAAIRSDDPLQRPEVRVVINDARTVLRRSRRGYDVIVSQPSHPWTAGASHLFSQEFYALVASRLNEGGILSQWIGGRFIDTPLLRSLLATINAEFEVVHVFRPSQQGALQILASQHDPLASSFDRRFLRYDGWTDLGILTPEDLAITHLLDGSSSRQLAGAAPRITDSRNLLQIESARVLRRGHGIQRPEELFASLDPLTERLQSLDERLTLARLLQTGEAQRAERLLGSATSKTRTWWSRIHANGDAANVLGRLSSRHPLALRAGELAQRADWQALRALDEELATVGYDDPAFETIARLRVRWRLASGEPNEAIVALELLRPLLGRRGSEQNLLLRAQAAELAGDPGLAVATLLQSRRIVNGRRQRTARWAPRAIQLLQRIIEESDDVDARALDLWQELVSFPGSRTLR